MCVFHRPLFLLGAMDSAAKVVAGQRDVCRLITTSKLRSHPVLVLSTALDARVICNWKQQRSERKFTYHCYFNLVHISARSSLRSTLEPLPVRVFHES